MTASDRNGATRPKKARPQNRRRPRTDRTENGKFKPGVSGNPGGRPKGLAAAVRERVPAEDLTRYYLAIWSRDERELRALDIALDEVTLTERNRAGEWLADRGYGKAPAHAPVEGKDPLGLSEVEGAIGATLDDLAARREAQAARGGEAPGVADRGAARADTA